MVLKPIEHYLENKEALKYAHNTQFVAKIIFDQ